jgi:hypothetical protein
MKNIYLEIPVQGSENWESEVTAEEQQTKAGK